MPIYEFRCGECGERFEALVVAGTEAEECPRCASPGAQRVMSLPARPPKLVRSAAGNRRQEEKNRKLHSATKESFKRKRRQAREGARRKGGGE